MGTEKKDGIFIKEIFLEAVNDNSLLVTAVVGDFNSRNKEKIVVPRSLVKGVLIKRY
jgi:hypothetical protein